MQELVAVRRSRLDRRAVPAGARRPRLPATACSRRSACPRGWAAGRRGRCPGGRSRPRCARVRRFFRALRDGGRRAPRGGGGHLRRPRRRATRAAARPAARARRAIEVQVLSAGDEARLGVAAALRSLPISDGVVADLGGGSLQLSRVRRRRVVSTASVPLGAVRTTRRFLHHDPPAGARAARRCGDEVREQLLRGAAAGRARRGADRAGGDGADPRQHPPARATRGEPQAPPRAARSASPTSRPSASGWNGVSRRRAAQDPRPQGRARRHHPGRRHRDRGGDGLRRLRDAGRVHARRRATASSCARPSPGAGAG